MKKYFLFLSILWLTSCSVSKNDLDDKVQNFLLDFNNRLSQSDDQIWNQFMTLQNKVEIFKAVRVLQNKVVLIKTNFVYSAATSTWEDGFLKVEIPVMILPAGRNSVESKVIMRLFPKGGRYFIGNFDAENLYRQAYALKNEIEDPNSAGQRMEFLRKFYDKAAQLQNEYDSVMWFIQHKEQTFFYAVKGNFNFDSLKRQTNIGFKMGLLNDSGRVIVPLEFDLVGTPEININSAVEVFRKGKVGCYSMEGKELIPSEFDWLLPYENNQIVIAKKDSVFGWFDSNFIYHSNFPSDKIEKEIRSLAFVSNAAFNFGKETTDVIESVDPYQDIPEAFSERIFHADGIIIPPSYLSSLGIFEQIEVGYLSSLKYEKEFYQSGSESKRIAMGEPFSLSENIKAFISLFQDRFVGGRGEFYDRHRINLVDDKMKLITAFDTPGGEEFSFKKINSEIFEAKYLEDHMGPNDLFEQNFPEYNYFSFDGKVLKTLHSDRRFPFTQFLRIDSTYLSGKFFTWSEGKGQGNSEFVSLGTVQMMRDEILASYGFVFPEGYPNSYSHFSWYKAYTSSYDEVYRIASDIDKYNLDFLTGIVGSKPWSKPT